MEFTVDRIALTKKLKGINRIAPQAGQVNFTTNDEDQLVLQPVVEGEYHTTKLPIDVLEDGEFSLDKKDVLKILDSIDGTTVTFTQDQDAVQVTTENATLSFPKIEMEIIPQPQYVVQGDIISADLRQGLMPIKEVIGKKSEKGTDQLLEALVVFEKNTLRVLSSNRIALFDMSLPIENSQFVAEEAYSFVPLQWAGLAELEEKNALSIISNTAQLGFKSDETLSLFRKGTPNALSRLTEVIDEIHNNEYSYETIQFDKRKITSVLNNLKKEKLFAQIEFGEDKFKVIGIDIAGNDVQQKMAFSVDFTGVTSVESLTVDPTHIMKIIKNIKGTSVPLQLPQETWLPVKIQNDDAALRLMGLTMCTDITRTSLQS